MCPGFGHRFHPVDPRARAACSRWRARRARPVSPRGASPPSPRRSRRRWSARGRRSVPLNIDGATAVIYGDLGFPPPLTRGLFVLSRSVGILAHAWEQSQEADRNKGPLPREWLWTYDGPARREVPRK